MRKLTLLFLGLASSAALAQEGIYVGIGVGSMDYSETTQSGLIPKVEDQVSAYKLYGGFEINDHFAIEINYGETDDVMDSGSQFIPGLGTVTQSTTTELATTVLRGIGQLSYEWGVLQGAIGFYSAEIDFLDTLMVNGSSGTIGGGFSDDGLSAMIGIEWRFGRFGTGFGVRLEYEWLDISDIDAETIGLGIAYRF